MKYFILLVYIFNIFILFIYKINCLSLAILLR
nr:MAG TPA: hypothetical protein [Caudoviricetes sp.]